MISGPDSRALRGLALGLFLATPAYAQQAWGLPQLMQALARLPAASATFSEQETSPVLSAPLTSTGSLTYVAPGYLHKVTISPAPEDFVLDHGQITLTSGGTTHVFTLNQDPRIAGLVEGISFTLSGDLPGLQNLYTLSLTGTAATWRLHLVPKDAALARFIRFMVITGTQNHVTSIDTASGDGSETRMSIAAVQPSDAP
ncbi:LolA-related protein [Acidocella sp.]|uniref:LolA-related protein n=1 Tax=Acidocella sp. TaxID=50710 RepID=UPI002611A897|nr:LolA-related protein [Acidocella sp.]